MAKIRNFAEIALNLPFTEYDFYEEYRGAFEKTDLGRMKRILPLHEMAKSLGLVSESLRPKRGRRSYFTPEGKVALMFLKMKTQKSFPKLMEALNGNIFYQMFCDIVIDPAHPLANYILLDDIALELAGKLKIQELQNVLAEMWKPYMKGLDTMYTDATCYESEMRYPTDQKLLWECIEKGYALMCEASLFSERENQTIAVITTVYRQQHNHFRSGDARESIPNRIVSVNKPYVRPIVRGKEAKNVEFGAKCNNILVDGISFIEKLSFNAFNEGTRLPHCIKMHKRLFGVDVKKIGGDTSYAGNTNRELCTSNGIHTSFVQKGKRAKEKREKDFVREDLARVRATTMEGSFGTQKEHYSMRRIKARMKMTEILYIFFGIHTANAVELSGRIAVLQPATG
ncbi:MAG: transposase [Paludibacteraceae bacterium]|nr:transposase [Paludibacteraceae bacterium]